MPCCVIMRWSGYLDLLQCLCSSHFPASQPNCITIKHLTYPPNLFSYFKNCDFILEWACIDLHWNFLLSSSWIRLCEKSLTLDVIILTNVFVQFLYFQCRSTEKSIWWRVNFVVASLCVVLIWKETRGTWDQSITFTCWFGEMKVVFFVMRSLDIGLNCLNSGSWLDREGYGLIKRKTCECWYESQRKVFEERSPKKV